MISMEGAEEAWEEAIKRFASKKDVAIAMRSAEWAEMPLAVRERAFFTAAVNDARVLSTIRTHLEKALAGRDPNRLRDGKAMTYSINDAIADIRKTFGKEGDSGRLTDLFSYRRQKLIQDFQTEQAYAYGRWKRDLEDGDLLDAYPAWRFTRVESRRNPRSTWMRRWAEAGQAVGWTGASQTRMVALKTSPIWSRLSRFDTPFPPFDYGSGMGVEDVDREEAQRLGLIPEDWDPKAEGLLAEEDFNSKVEMSIRGMDDATKAKLGTALSGMAEFVGDKIRMITPRPKIIPPAEADRILSKDRKVVTATGEKVTVGKRLKDKLDKQPDGTKRKERLIWALATLRQGRRQKVFRNGEWRWVYYAFFREPGKSDAGFLVVVDAADLHSFNIYRSKPKKIIKSLGLDLRNQKSPSQGECPPTGVLESYADTNKFQECNWEAIL